jgi:hypothetical protein
MRWLKIIAAMIRLRYPGDAGRVERVSLTEEGAIIPACFW